jgi:hypothetical protein
MTEKEAQDQKTAAASYLMTFYSEVMNLTDYYARYVNMMVEVRNKKGSITEEERANHFNMAQVLRYSIIKSFVQYSVITGHVPDASFKTTEENYVKVKDQLLIDDNDAGKYVLALNKYLVQEIIKTLLETSAELISQIYDGTKTDIIAS